LALFAQRRSEDDDGTFSEFCGKEPCWRLGNPKMFKDTHPHLFNIAGPKDSCSKPSSMIVVGLSDAAISTAISW
jgi:hypothetical protein